MKLDRSKSFGKISGETYIPDGCDRPAHYEQGGKLFDAHDRLIIPGEAASDPDNTDDDIPEGLTAASLLFEAEAMSLRKLKVAATVVLGETCPATKSGIIEALKAAQAEFDSRAAKRAKPAKESADKSPKAEDVKPASGSSPDLAAWATGRKEYLWGDIRKTIKSKYGRNVHERDDAVEFLISQGVIRAEYARQDVIRGAGQQDQPQGEMEP